MKNIQELRESLINDREKMLTGHIKLPLAEQRTANANAIIKTCLLELAFYTLTKQEPNIPFISNGTAKPVKAREVAQLK